MIFEAVKRHRALDRRAFKLGGAAAIAILGLASTVRGSAKDAKTVITPDQQIFFEGKIRPVLIRNCFGCHGPNDQKGGLRLDSLDAMLKGNASGPVLIAGDVAKSRILNVIHYDGPVKMPPSAKLRAEEIEALTEWVQMGAPWPQDKVAPPVGQAPEYVISPAQKKFWSFQPVRKPSLPAVKNAVWCVSPIDRFVLAKLESRGLKPAPPADRRTLIRRVTLDLIGLPPTNAEVDAFLADKSPDAWPHLVDRLLANPHYGERWGRHWLDLVRYADSNGLDENVAFANAFKYRDYVVGAFNKDLPYNEFIREQLAGDLLTSATPEQRNERLTATGFLELGPKVLAEPDKDKLQMDIVDEQIDVTSKAFLGLTVTCARCHNHKFDPIPTKDYYALAGIFKSTRTMESLNTVAMWRERPLTVPGGDEQMRAQQTKIASLEKDVSTARAHADQNLESSISKDAAKYILAGWEPAQRADLGLHSLAETPVLPGDPARITINAVKYVRGNANRDFQTYGKGIGIIHTTQVPTTAEWDVPISKAGLYQLDLRYASGENRPVRLIINGKNVRDDAAPSITGEFQPENQRWEAQGIYTFNAGNNTIRIECDNSIPHFHLIMLIPVSDDTKAGTNAAARTVEQVAEADHLNPAILRQAAQYLHDRRNQQDFASWRSMAFATSADIDARSRKLAEKIAAGDGPDASALRTALGNNDGKSGILTLPSKHDQFFAESDAKAIAAAEQSLKVARENAPKPEMAMAVEEGTIADCKVHIRGDTQNLGDVVPRHFLTVLGGGDLKIDPTHSGRLELAQWLADPKNPLPARVAVNKIWQGHFGAGLVRTPDNWGLLGLQPSHPELLDWLASEFVEQGWSFKKMHRIILLSNTYKMSTTPDPKTETLASASDPDNQLLWKMPRMRMEAEEFRDSLLAVAGRLDLSMGGSLLKTGNHDYVTNDQSGNAAQYGSPRRGLYLPIIRNALFDMFQAFDYGDPSMVNAKRSTTTVSSQALFVMNSPFLLEQSKALAKDTLAQPGLSEADRVKYVFLKAFNRPPTAEETGKILNYLSAYSNRVAPNISDSDKRHEAAWDSLCHIIFSSNEFIYIN